MKRALTAALLLMLPSCSRHDVGDEKNNPAPSSSLTLQEAEAIGANWALAGAGRKWSVPSPTSSMVPYCDSHTVVLLEPFVPPARLHDVLRLNEGPDRLYILHQADDVKDGYVHIAGKNNQTSDGWYPLSQVQYRAVGFIYSKGP